MKELRCLKGVVSRFHDSFFTSCVCTTEYNAYENDSFLEFNFPQEKCLSVEIVRMSKAKGHLVSMRIQKGPCSFFQFVSTILNAISIVP